METPKTPGAGYPARYRNLPREIRPPGCAWPDLYGEAAEPVPVFNTGPWRALRQHRGEAAERHRSGVKLA
jgi:hypothetical protein